MNEQAKYLDQPLHVSHYALLLGMMWTAVVLAALGWNVRLLRASFTQMAWMEAKGSANKDLLLQQWISRQGGIYVLTSKEIEPNPYLSHIAERDIATPSGRTLTLMNAAYVIRQVYENLPENAGLRGHFTSLKPIRPQNRPDPWEAAALRSFEADASETHAIEILDGHPYMRFMRPMFVTDRCLKCHAQQGYQSGQIRGGLSVSIPMTPYWTRMRGDLVPQIAGYGLIWSLGTVGIAASARGLKIRILEREKMRKTAQESEEMRLANERMRQNLIAAAQVQRGFMPENPPVIPGFHFAWLFKPSEYIGGDLLNIHPLGAHRWAFYILDVSGHGVPAALLSVSISHILDQLILFPAAGTEPGGPNTLEEAGPALETLVQHLNQRFPGDKMMFCTLVFGILDTRDASVTWIRAGHEPPLRVKRSGAEIQYFHVPGGPFINAIGYESHPQQIQRLLLEPGDRFILFSDGIIEARRDHQEFGYERFAEAMRETLPQPADKALQLILQRASEWSGSPEFVDDVTLLVLERTRD
ncbi:MAG: SpoIIE family protein phosphatase [bacterium]